MAIATQHLARSIETLESSLASLRRAPDESVEFEVFRNAVVKGFELTLGCSERLLRLSLKEFVAVPHRVDALEERDVLRTLNRHGLLTEAEVERWFVYLEMRSSIEDRGALPESTLALLKFLAADCRRLNSVVLERLKEVDA